MNGEYDHHQVTIAYPVNSWKESVRLTMVNQESVFNYQLNELHRIYKKQVELMGGLEGTGTQLTYTRKRSKKLKFDLKEEPVNVNEVKKVPDADAPTTPEATNSGNKAPREDVHARSAAETLVAMSAPELRAASHTLLWFANIAASVTDADLASVKGRCRLTRMPGQHGKCQVAKKRKKKNVGPCIGSWGKIKNGGRSKRVRDSDPLYTFKRGAFLCKWR